MSDLACTPSSARKARAPTSSTRFTRWTHLRPSRQPWWTASTRMGMVLDVEGCPISTPRSWNRATPSTTSSTSPGKPCSSGRPDARDAGRWSHRHAGVPRSEPGIGKRDIHRIRRVHVRMISPSSRKALSSVSTLTTYRGESMSCVVPLMRRPTPLPEE